VCCQLLISTGMPLLNWGHQQWSGHCSWAQGGPPYPGDWSQCAYLVEPLDLLLLVLALPGEWAQLILQVLDLLVQLLGLCC
jgi:hypothetical protein